MFFFFFSFLCSRAYFSRGESSPRLFHTPLRSALSEGNLLFIALCEGMQGRKEEGKTMVSTATGLKQPTRSRCRFSGLVLNRRCRRSLGVCLWERRGVWIGSRLIDIFPSLARLLQPSLRANRSFLSSVNSGGRLFCSGLQQYQWSGAGALGAATGKGRVDRRDEGEKWERAALIHKQKVLCPPK